MLTPLIRAMLKSADCPTDVLRDALLDEGVVVATVYVITGCSGSHSETNIWDVCAFLCREEADIYVARLKAWAAEAGLLEDENHDPSRKALRAGWPACPLDPNVLSHEHTGVDWAVFEIPLKG